MGSSFITKDEARKRLGVSQATIYRYLRKGLLKPQRLKGELYVDELEVARLKDLLEVHSDPRDIEIALLKAEVGTLQSQMSMLMRIMEIRRGTLNLTDPEIVAFYRSVEEYTKNGWSPFVETELVDNMGCLRVEDLQQLERLTGDEHPWRVFLNLTNQMHHSPFDKSLRFQIAESKSHLENLAGVWVTLKGQNLKTFERLVNRDAKPGKRVLNKREREKVVLRRPGEA